MSTENTNIIDLGAYIDAEPDYATAPKTQRPSGAPALNAGETALEAVLAEETPQPDDSTDAEPAPRVYISGPMRGLPEFNYPAFHRLAAILRGRGFAAFNPAEQFAGATDLEWQTYMRHDLSALLECDAVCVLPGWENSTGALVEVAVARAIGLPIFDAESGSDVEGLMFDAHNGVLDVLAGGARADTAARQDADDIPEIDVAPEGITNILLEANRMVNGQRQSAYGHPIDHHGAVAQMWSALKGVRFDASEVSLFWIADKLVREMNHNKLDNSLDIAGYAQVHRMVIDAQAERAAFEGVL